VSYLTLTKPVGWRIRIIPEETDRLGNMAEQELRLEVAQLPQR
jgi:hypothetical protein